MPRSAYWFALLTVSAAAAACGDSSGLTCKSGSFYRDGHEFLDCSQCPSSDCAFESSTTQLCTYPNGVQHCTESGTETAHCGSERATVDINDDVPSCGGASSTGSSGSGGGAMPGTSTGGTRGSGGAGGATSEFANCTFPTIGLAPTRAAAPTRDNSADLSGATLGTVAFDQSTMRRMVPVTVQSGLDGLQFGSAYLTRTDASETAYLTVPITNSGSNYYCFIEANPLQYLSSDGTSLSKPTNIGFVNGSVGALGSGTYTDTCLAAGESGYIIDIQPGTDGMFFSDTASIGLTLSSSSLGAVPGASLVPQSYDVGTCSSLRSIRVTSLATGTLPVAVGGGLSLAPAIFLDEQGLPAGWAYAENDQLETVPPGGTVSTFAITAWAPAVSRAQFFIAFSKPTASADTSDAVGNKLQQVWTRNQELSQRWKAAARASTTGELVRHERSWIPTPRAPDSR